MDGGFDDVVGAVGEEGVGFLNAAEREAVGYQMGCVDFAFGDELHDFVAVAGIDSPGLEREVLTVHPRQRQYLCLLIESDNRDDGIRSGTTPCEFKRIIASCNLNHAVCATPLCRCLKDFKTFCRLDYIDIRM